MSTPEERMTLTVNSDNTSQFRLQMKSNGAKRVRGQRVNRLGMFGILQIQTGGGSESSGTGDLINWYILSINDNLEQEVRVQLNISNVGVFGRDILVVKDDGVFSVIQASIRFLVLIMKVCI